MKLSDIGDTDLTDKTDLAQIFLKFLVKIITERYKIW